MTRLIILAVLVGVLFGWPSSAEAKTTYYECGYNVYKLEEPWIGFDRFYLLQDGDFIGVEVQEITSEFIRYFMNYVDGERIGPLTINRVTLSDGLRTCQVIDGPK